MSDPTRASADALHTPEAEQKVEWAPCSPNLLAFKLEVDPLTDEERQGVSMPPEMDRYWVRIGVQRIPLFANKNEVPSVRTQAAAEVRYEILDRPASLAEKIVRILVTANGKTEAFQGEIFLEDRDRLRSQYLTDGEAREIAETLDVKYWQERTKETVNGIINYAKGDEPIKAGAAADRGYTLPESEKPMEDRGVIDPANGLFAVFDGVGSGGNGDVAATITAETFHEVTGDTKMYRSPEHRLRRAFAVADHRIRAYAEKAGLTRSPHTTAAVAYIEHAPNGQRTVWIASAGDSRVYLCRPDRAIYPLTVDDGVNRNFSLLPDLQRQRSDENRYVTKYVGQNERNKSYADEIAIRSLKLQPEEFLVFTTDGIHDVLATTEKAEARMSNFAYGRVTKVLKEMFKESSVEDIRRYFTEPPSKNIFNEAGSGLDPALRSMVADFYGQERTLANAVFGVDKDADPQAIANNVLKVTEEVHALRKDITELEDRSKFDNRLVIVVK